MTERTFTVHETRAAVGMTTSCLHQWIEREYFAPLREAPPGIARPYTLRDIIHLAAIVELGMAGVQVARASQILGASPLETAGRQTVVARHGNVEIRLDAASIADRIRTALIP